MADDVRTRMFLDRDDMSLFGQAAAQATDYAAGLRGRAIYPTAEALDGLAAFDEPFPDRIGDAKEILALLQHAGSPATVNQSDGRYFGFVNGGVVPVALAVRWLTDFWDQNPALHVISPVAARLEQVCETWLADLLGLGKGIAAGFVSGSSTAIFGGLAAARYRCLANQGWDVNTRGLAGAKPLRVVATDQAHGTVKKAVALLGLGTGHVEWVATDAQGRMRADRLPALDPATIVVLQAGNVMSGSFDPFDAVCDAANSAGAWVHIDGAFGLWAAGSAATRHLTNGIEKAQSWSLDGHKTLNAPYDNGILLCRDRDALVAAMQTSGSYIIYGEQRDGMLFTPEMSRRARAADLWATLKFLGREGLDQLVHGLHLRARQFGDELRAAGFRILNDVVFNQVIVAATSEAETARTMELVQQSGDCWVGGATWRGERVIRVSVCDWATTPEDVSRSVAAFDAARQKAVAGETGRDSHDPQNGP